MAGKKAKRTGTKSMILGLRSKVIKLIPHAPEWEEVFIEEKRRIKEKIGDIVLDIEHVGSTSIKTICAKPIIDIGISIRKYEDGFECVKPLENLGYLYKGECGVPGRHYFRTNNDIVKFHISMFPVTSEEWKDHILFRDYLNQNPDVARKYEELKFKLMNEFAGDRVRYTESKDPFIKKVLEKARKEKDNG